MKSPPTLRSLIVLGAVGTCCAVAQANPVKVIYTKIPTHASSVIPGALDLNGDPAASNWRALEDIITSSDGSRWILKGRTQLGSDLENIMHIGSGANPNAANFAQEGQPIPDGEPGELYDFFGSGLGTFNDNNEFGYSARARGGNAAIFQKVIVYTGGLTPQRGSDFELVAAMGDLYIGLEDLAPNPSGDETVGNSIGSIHLLNDGSFGSQDSTILNIHTSRRPAITYDLERHLQNGVDTVLDLDGVTVRLLKTLSANSFYTTPDGARYITRGQIQTGGTTDDDVLILNGQVVLKEGSPIGDSGVIVGTIVDASIASSGDWYARGAIAGGGVYAVVNGTIVARTGGAITSGEGEELWGTAFLSFKGNSNGDWVLVGTTNNANNAMDTVMVLNGETVLLREGDAITLDGFKGPIFVGRGNPTLGAMEVNDTVITDGGRVYSLISIHDGAGNDYNSDPSFGSPQAFVTIFAGVCPGDTNGDGVVDFADFSTVLNEYGMKGMGLAGDLNGDGVVDFADFSEVLANYGNFCF